MRSSNGGRVETQATFSRHDGGQVGKRRYASSRAEGERVRAFVSAHARADAHTNVCTGADTEAQIRRGTARFRARVGSLMRTCLSTHAALGVGARAHRANLP